VSAVLQCDETSCNYILLRALTVDFDVQRFVRDARLLRNQYVSISTVTVPHMFINILQSFYLINLA